MENISPHFCDRMRWTRCAQIVFRYLPRFRAVSVAKIHWLRHLWTCERREWGRLGLKYASPLKKGKSHAIWVLSETLSPPIEKFFAQDLQLLRPPALLPTTNKPQNRKRGGQLQGFINLAKSHGSLVACWCNIGDFLWKWGTLIFRISRQILGQGDRVLLQGGAGW